MICSGSIPSPRISATAAVINDKVWLCGGKGDFDLYELNMHSLSWTQIETGMPRPLSGHFHRSLTPIQDSHLVVHGDVDENSTWILDVESHTWRTHLKQGFRYFHSGITGLNGDVITLGGLTSDTTYKPLVNVRLWPKSLQQLAMRIVYGNRTDLPLKSLPPKLLRKMMDTETE